MFSSTTRLAVARRQSRWHGARSHARPKRQLQVQPLEDRTVPAYTFTTIDVPGAIETNALANNDNGDIVGAYRAPDNQFHGFILSGGTFTTIDDPPGNTAGTGAVGINNAGQITGSYGVDGFRDWGYVFDGATFTTIDPPGSVENGANKINSSGQVVGGFSTGGYLIGQHGYIYSAGNYTQLDFPEATDTFASGINDLGQVVGAFGDFHSGVRHGYLLSGGTYTGYDVPGASSTEGLAINNLGQIAGRFNDGSYHGYIIDGAEFKAIDVPGSTYTEADGINNLGVIVGTYTDSAGVTHGFVATPDENQAPTLDPIPDQTVAETGTLTLIATATDPDLGQALTYSLISGPAGSAVDPLTGVFTWTPADGPDSANVTVRVTDNGSPALEDTESFTVTVNNRPPVATLAGPASGVRGQERVFTLGAADPSAADQAAGFTYSVDWGDGSSQTIAGPAGLLVPHTFTATGTYTITVTATDRDAGASDPVVQTIAIYAVELQGDTLVVGGTLDDDDITFKAAAQGQVKVLIDSVSHGVFSGVGRLHAIGQAGDDNIRVMGGVSRPAILDGGDGHDQLVAGPGNSVLRGGAGVDRLRGGSGDDLLDGGEGFLDFLTGLGGNDTLVDADGVLEAAGGAGQDDITIAFAPDWTINGSRTLPGGSITGGNGNDVMRITSNQPALRFDVSGSGGSDRVELRGTWQKARVYGAGGVDTLVNLGVGLVVPFGIETEE